jgi:signal transduction histidine kinase/ActR/RegA family two-component response regulator
MLHRTAHAAPALTDASHLAGLLDSQFDQLSVAWRARALARSARAPELGPHVATLLRYLIAHLATPEEAVAGPGSGVTKPPEIFQQAFDLEAVIYEYGLLQRIVLELLESASVPVSMRDVRNLGDWFTRAVAGAAAEQAAFGAAHSRPDSVRDTQRSAGQGPVPALVRATPSSPEARSGAWPVTTSTAGLESAVESPRVASAPVDSAGVHGHALLMQAPVAVSVVRGPEFVYVFANPLALAMGGRTDVVGKSVRQAFPELDEQAPVLQVLQRVYSRGEPFSSDEYLVPFDRSGSGSIENVYFKFTCQPIREADGEVHEILMVAADVTSQVQARQKVELLLADLTRADQRKDEFLAMLAHELRNPMAAISTALSLLDQAGDDTSQSLRYRETARRQMNNLVRLVDDLLDVARITRGKVELRKEDVDLAAVIQHALAATRPLIEARQHELSVTLAPGSFHASADATRLEQVLVNLLTNAVKYTDPGGSISVRLSRDEDQPQPEALISVRDTGRGIPFDMLDKVFELFTQVTPSIDRNTGGLGLGLTLVKHLIEMHGGSVSARSAGLGQGSEFLLRMPLLVDAVAEARVLEPRAADEPRSQRRRVVVVEDSEDVRELLQECIERLGHEVLVAEAGPEGLALICQVRPDLALIDVGLPGIDGYEVARRARVELRGHPVRLVALTGYGGADVKKTAKDAGFDEHVTKPIEIERLLELLSRDSQPT